ncbi:MAG: glycosyltransferase family 1 protein [Caldilineaceae bacterium]
MHVAVNAQLLSAETSYRAAGVSKYSYHLLRALHQAATAEDVNFTAFVPASAAPIIAADLANRQRIENSKASKSTAQYIRLAQTSLPMQQPLVRIAWEQTWLPLRLAQIRADLVHGLVNVLPLSGQTPGVVTVHDLSFLRMPEVLPAFKRRYLAALCQRSVHKAQQVIAVSQQTADDLMHYFGLASRKINVIHNGVDERFEPGDPRQIAQFRREHGLPHRFLLYIGTLEPRKNLPLLIRAFARWRATAGPSQQDVKLVVAGAKGWFYEQIFAEVNRLHMTEHVLFPGFLPDEDLPNWYRAALAFVYPTRFEGFGLPVLEAMSCGTPVICSQAPSLLEIVGDQALTHAVDDEEGLSRHMAQIVKNAELRAALAEGGLQRARAFSWVRTATETLAVYRLVLK